MRKIAILFLILTLLLTPVSANQTGADNSEISWDDYIQDFFNKYSINPDTIALGYYNTVTGEEHYHNGDKYMLGASVYKVPLNMHYAERVADGEMTMETKLFGITYEFAQTWSIQYSDNFISELLQGNLGDYADYRRAIAKYLGVSEANIDEEYLGGNYFTPRQMVHCLKMLYDEPERYPNILEQLQLSNPNAYFEREVKEYEIAQKYGYISYEANTHLNVVGIIYTEEPIIAVIFTHNCNGGEATLGRYAKAMCEYAEMTVGSADSSPQIEETPQLTPAPTPNAANTETPEPTPEAELSVSLDEDEEGKYTAVRAFRIAVVPAAIIAILVIIKKNSKMS